MSSNLLTVNHHDTDSIAFVLGYVNPVNITLMQEAYNLYRSLYENDESLDSKIGYLMAKADSCDRSFVSLNINTIFKEVYINRLIKLGLEIDWDITIHDLVVLLRDIETLRVNDDVIDILREVSNQDCELYSLFHKIGLSSVDLIEFIKSSDDFIDSLYSENFDLIHVDTTEPLDLPEVG